MQKLFKNVGKMAQMRLINSDKLYWICIAGSVATPLLGKTRIDQSATILVEGRIAPLPRSYRLVFLAQNSHEYSLGSEGSAGSQYKEQTVGSLLRSCSLHQQMFRLTASVIQFYSLLAASMLMKLAASKMGHAFWCWVALLVVPILWQGVYIYQFTKKFMHKFIFRYSRSHCSLLHKFNSGYRKDACSGFILRVSLLYPVYYEISDRERGRQLSWQLLCAAGLSKHDCSEAGCR